MEVQVGVTYATNAERKFRVALARLDVEIATAEVAFSASGVQTVTLPIGEAKNYDGVLRATVSNLN